MTTQGTRNRATSDDVVTTLKRLKNCTVWQFHSRVQLLFRHGCIALQAAVHALRLARNETKPHLKLFPLPTSLESPSIVSAPRLLRSFGLGAGNAGLGAVPEMPPLRTAVVAIAPITGTGGSPKVAGAVVPRTATSIGVGPMAGANAKLGIDVLVSPREAATASLVAGAAAGLAPAPVEAPLPLVLEYKKNISRKW